MKSETAGLKTEEDTSGEVSPEELKDPMSGYSTADALGPGARVNEEGVDKVHADEMKDAMSGYASADALESDEK
jgi:hypothetical protein